MLTRKKLTSLGGQNLTQKFPDNPYFRHMHLPIFPCNAHPDHGTQLFLEGGMQLRRDSYVKTEFRWELSWELLDHYDDTGKEYKLHPVSYRDLMAYRHTPYTKSLEPWPQIQAHDAQSTTENGLDLEQKKNFADHPIADKVNSMQALWQLVGGHGHTLTRF